jgi:hypothetical protein
VPRRVAWIYLSVSARMRPCPPAPSPATRRQRAPTAGFGAAARRGRSVARSVLQPYAVILEVMYVVLFAALVVGVAAARSPTQLSFLFLLALGYLVYLRTALPHASRVDLLLAAAVALCDVATLLCGFVLVSGSNSMSDSTR